jgi:hypothetical protein
MTNRYQLYCITEDDNITISQETPPIICPNDSRHDINLDSVIILDGVAGNGMLFGNGIDGSVTIEGKDVSLSEDMYFDNLTIDGANLYTNGYRVFVSSTTTFLNGGCIVANGTDANSRNGAMNGTNGVYASGTSGGTSSGSQVNGSPGETAAEFSIGGRGGSGGSGRNGITPLIGGNGGTTNDIPAQEGGFKLLYTPNGAMAARTLSGALICGGTGGGSGAGGGTALGGGGGAGGNVLFIASYRIDIIDGGFAANGGAGANGIGGNSGGGGGGGGGCVIIITTEGLDKRTISVSGGVGGLGTGTGSRGSNGNDGKIFVLLV